jgi:peptide-methionine (R)-S-oxide reductase
VSNQGPRGPQETIMHRRNVLQWLAGALGAAAVPAAAADKVSTADIEQMRRDWKSLLPRNADVPLAPQPLSWTRDAWKRVLTPAQFAVLRDEGTERPGSSPLNNEKRAGVFVCAGCSLPLFTSRMKYESGTGWPSFFTSIPGHFATKEDRKLFSLRTEYHCARCGGHHGHLFDDGPAPTRERWCNNGVALRFLPADA